MNFRELNLNPSILSALETKGYEIPTPIQAASIPPVLAGKDLLGCAQTGTGKTAAFALPILHNLSAKIPNGPKRIRALILAPTRELAVQIGESFQAYGKGLSLRGTTVFGGVSDFGQKQKLRQGVDIVVATPGRLLDLYEQKSMSFAHVEIFVLDEADRMMDMGFIHDVRRIAALLPAKRQTLFFSATMPPEIRALSKSLLHDPVHVEVAPVSSTAANIDQAVYHISGSQKASLLRHLLADETIRRALVFTRTKHGADRIHKVLDRYSIPAEALHGNKTQGARQRALNNFKSGQTRVLIATDIASRGIDVTDISHVFNYDLPEVPETYVHRIGRTARAGASGIAVTFCGSEERSYLMGIERLTRQRIRVIPLPAELPETKMLPSDRAPNRPTRDGSDRERTSAPKIHHDSARPYAPVGASTGGSRFGRRGDSRGSWQKSGNRSGGRPQR